MNWPRRIPSQNNSPLQSPPSGEASLPSASMTADTSPENAAPVDLSTQPARLASQASSALHKPLFGGDDDSPLESDAETRDIELIVAVFRTIVLLAALLLPKLVNPELNYSPAIMWLAGVAGAYNVAIGFAYLSPGPFGLRRPIVLAMDVVLITWWIQLSGRWDLFPLFYVVVVVAAMWFRVFGGVVTALFCDFFFMYLWARMAGDMSVAPILPSTLALNLVLLIMVACLVGSVSEAQEREKRRRLEGQLLVANYQREIDIAMQMQPLLVPSHWFAESGTLSDEEIAPPTDERVTQISSAAPDDATQASTQLRERVLENEVPPEERHDVRPLPPMYDRNLQIGAAMRPARQFGGGDYFDIIPLGAGRTALCIADVSGKSVRAQARLPLLKYSLRALAPLYDEPAELMKRLNETLAPDLQGEFFIGLCYIVLDSRFDELLWCNAGHIAPLLLSASEKKPKREAKPESSEYSQDEHFDEEPAQVSLLETSGPALGPFPELSYSSGVLPWRSGDRLLLYTDGLTDALAYGGSEDGEDQVRLTALAIDNHYWNDLPAVAQRFVDLGIAALEYTENRLHPLAMLRGETSVGQGRRDDITVVVLRRLPEL